MKGILFCIRTTTLTQPIQLPNLFRANASARLALAPKRLISNTPLKYVNRAEMGKYRRSLFLQRTGLSSSPQQEKMAIEKSVESVHPDGLTRYPSLSSPNGILRGLDWMGTLVFASSATVTAGTCGLDLLGCTIVGTITATGGGTIRDLFLGNTPVFWMQEVEYIYMCLIGSLLTFFGWKSLDGLLDEDDDVLFWADAIGLGAFCVIGCQNGIRKGLAPVLCVFCGLLTATFGGVTRDVICRRPVRICHSNAELYGTTAIAGSTMYLAARALNFSPAVRITSGISTAVFARYMARKNDLKLPLWPRRDIVPK